MLKDKTIVDEEENDEFAEHTYNCSDGTVLYTSRNFGQISYSPAVADEKKREWQIVHFSGFVETGLYPLSLVPNALSKPKDFPKADAVSRAEKLLEELELPEMGEPNIFFFSAEDMNAIAEAEINEAETNNMLLKEKPPKMKKADEFYLIMFPLKFAEAVYYHAARSPFEPVVKVFLTRDEILKIETLFLCEVTEELDEVQITDPADAVAKLFEYYKNINPSAPVEVNSCGLYYKVETCDIEANEAVYKPYWIFSGYYTDRGEKWNLTVRADAATGVILQDDLS